MAKAKIKEKPKRSLPDLRKLKFLELYFTPGTKYFNNGLQSALKAGFSQEYSENILSTDLKWLADGLSEIVGKPTDVGSLAKKARRVLDKSLESDDQKLAQDTAKFVADKTDPEFSTKQDVRITMPTPIYGGLSKKGIDEV